MIYEKLKESFDFVGAFNVERYSNYEKQEDFNGIKTVFVVGLAYPREQLMQQRDRFVASMYSYGLDYHDVLKGLMHETLKGENYKALVDNHEIDERKCLEITGLAYRGKNNLMIHREFGSFFFIGLVLTEEEYPEIIEQNVDSCGDCNICLKACPVGALSEFGYDVSKCMSGKNQSKRSLSEEVIMKNYLLLGCDICQIVCPKNRGLDIKYNEKFNIRPTTYVLMSDLFELSNKEFKEKYGKHAYTWRGKTILLRNALTLLLKQKNTEYNELIKATIISDKYPLWYKTDAINILNKLEEIKI